MHKWHYICWLDYLCCSCLFLINVIVVIIICNYLDNEDCVILSRIEPLIIWTTNVPLVCFSSAERFSLNPMAKFKRDWIKTEMTFRALIKNQPPLQLRFEANEPLLYIHFLYFSNKSKQKSLRIWNCFKTLENGNRFFFVWWSLNVCLWSIVSHLTPLDPHTYNHVCRHLLGQQQHTHTN